MTSRELAKNRSILRRTLEFYNRLRNEQSSVPRGTELECLITDMLTDLRHYLDGRKMAA